MFRFVPPRGSRKVGQGLSRLLKTTTRVNADAVRQGGQVASEVARKAARKAVEAVKARTGPAPHAPPGRFVEVDGVRVHVIVQGQGRPVVLIHGNGTMAEDWVISGVVERLARSYRVIAIDRPGFGHSDRPRHRVWTAAAQARLLHGVLGKLSVERPVLVGHSWGTLVAFALAAQGQDDLRGLVLLSGYYYPTRRADVGLIAPLAVPGLGDAARAMTPDSVGRLVAPGVFRHVFSPQPVPARFTARFPVAVAVHPRQARASAEDTATMTTAAALLQPHYPRLRLPVAILSGDADAVVDPREQSCRLHDEVAGSTLTLLPGKGHMIHYGAAARIARVVDGQMALTGRALRWQ